MELRAVALEIRDIQSQLDEIETRLQVFGRGREDTHKERVALKTELAKVKERVAFIESRLK